MRIVSIGLLAVVLLAACSAAAGDQPAPAYQGSAVVTLFKPPT